MTAEKADRNDLAYGMITKGLKNLAKELDCVVVLLTQLNRALESRTNKRPLPSDSRDTGQIEQDCDYWVGIHREGAFDDSVPPGETELILRLNRHGNTGTVYCIQANGAIYDTDQQSAEMRRREREDPDNDFFELRADDLRDERSYRRRIQASAKKLANNIESAIAKQATEMGSLVVHDTRAIGPSTGLSGWDFVSDAERLMFSRELNRDMGISYFLNPDDYRKAGRNLVDGDIFGRVPEEAYRNGTIQRQIAGFDEILRSPKLPAVTKSTATGVTVSGAQKFKPQAYTLDTDGNKENVDNRVATVTVSSTTGFKRGDKISFTGVKFLSQMAKNVLTDDATFSITRVIDGTHIEITPKPIALDDASLTKEEKAYANVNTSLADTTPVR